MNILSQISNFQNKNSFINNLSTVYNEKASPYFTKRSTSNYTSTIEAIGSLVYHIAREQVKLTLESIDLSFRNSSTRKQRYHVKNTRSRTLVTPFGEITYTRTIYSFKDKSKGTYTHVDEIFNIPKYDRYDPCVQAQMISLYANHNSMIKVGKILGEQIFSPFSLDEKKFLYAIPRQTIQTTIKKAAKIQFPLNKRDTTPEVLYKMADEKWIALQSPNEDGSKQKQMVKAAVVFEDIRTVTTKILVINQDINSLINTLF